MRTIGISMIGLAIAMFVLARSRDGEAAYWLRSDNRQMAYVMMIAGLIGLGFAMSLAG